MNKTEGFDYKEFEKEALLKLKQGVSLEGENAILAPLLKRLLEAGLQGELDGHLSTPDQSKNRRNSLSSKKVKTHYGSIEVTTPRDRNGSFEPELLPKRQTTLIE
ncbi:MAG: family transposase [Bacteroidetes bacterium]|nr:family transposase [Bacteroidota bacterium]